MALSDGGQREHSTQGDCRVIWLHEALPLPLYGTFSLGPLRALEAEMQLGLGGQLCHPMSSVTSPGYPPEPQLLCAQSCAWDATVVMASRAY